LIKIAPNTFYSLEVLVTDSKGKGIDGLSIDFEIIKVFDSNTTVLAGTMDVVGKGVYKKDIKLTTVGQYRVEYRHIDVEGYYLDTIETIIVEQPVVLMDNIPKVLDEVLSHTKSILKFISVSPTSSLPISNTTPTLLPISTDLDEIRDIIYNKIGVDNIILTLVTCFNTTTLVLSKRKGTVLDLNKIYELDVLKRVLDDNKIRGKLSILDLIKKGVIERFKICY